MGACFGGKTAEKTQRPSRIAAILSGGTFYDASCAYLVEKENLKLVTVDTDLLKKCMAAISVNEMK